MQIQRIVKRVEVVKPVIEDRPEYHLVLSESEAHWLYSLVGSVVIGSIPEKHKDDNHSLYSGLRDCGARFNSVISSFRVFPHSY